MTKTSRFVDAPKCRWQGKLKFRNRLEAELALTEILAKDARQGRIPAGCTYLCPAGCGGWHTSGSYGPSRPAPAAPAEPLSFTPRTNTQWRKAS